MKYTTEITSPKVTIEEIKAGGLFADEYNDLWVKIEPIRDRNDILYEAVCLENGCLCDFHYNEGEAVYTVISDYNLTAKW